LYRSALDDYFVSENHRVVAESPSLGLQVGARTADLLHWIDVAITYPGVVAFGQNEEFAGQVTVVFACAESSLGRDALTLIVGDTIG
jgi:hypothetical protein